MDQSALLKRLMKVQASNISHSSGLVVKNGSTFGAASSESFEQRKRTEANRTKIRKYGDSAVVQGVRNGSYNAKKYDSSAANNSRLNSGSATRGQNTGRSVTGGAGNSGLPNRSNVGRMNLGVRRNPGIFR